MRKNMQKYIAAKLSEESERLVNGFQQKLYGVIETRVRNRPPNPALPIGAYRSNRLI
jgi:hypothetical protein